MRALILFLMLSSVAVGCKQSRQIQPRERTAQAQFADTGFVRKHCAQADSVLAGRKACVLMYQAPKVRVF